MLHKAPIVLLALLVFLVFLAVATSGCARRAPIATLGDRGDVGVVLDLASGETLRGRLLSIDGGEMTLEVHYAVRGDVRLTGSGDRRRLEDGGAPVPGELVSVERDGSERIATVCRTIDVGEIDRATFHRDAGEASLGPVLSSVVGPAVGALLALAI